MNEFKLVCTVAALIMVSACSRLSDKAVDGKESAAEHGHEHGSGVAVTHYAGATELFVEYAPLVRGQAADFGAHLTRLADFKAVDSGKLTVMLTGGNQPQESAEASVSQTPGIFRPTLTPQHAGTRRLVFVLAAPNITSTHDLGEVQVFADKKTAEAVPKQPESEGIKYTKEQQWKTEFETQTVAGRTVRESIPVTATIRPRASGEAMITAPGTGMLRPAESGFPQLGLRVTAGQILAYAVPKLGGDTDVATLGLNVERAQLELEQARQERTRLEKLLTAEAIPERRVHDARTKERISAAELTAAQRRVATYRGEVGGIPLKSPISGTVVAVNTSPGAAIADGQLLFHVADLRKLWLEARIPESELGRIDTPAGVSFGIEGEHDLLVLEGGKNARLVAFGGLIDKDTRTAPAIFEFDNPAGRLKAGMNLRALLFTGRSMSTPAVPAAAVVDDNGQPVVFVQQTGESFERRVVSTGTRDGPWLGIRSGLEPGERVVSRGAYQVRLAATAPAAPGHGHAH